MASCVCCVGGGVCGAGVGFVSGLIPQMVTCGIAYVVLKVLKEPSVQTKPLVTACLVSAVISAVIIGAILSIAGLILGSNMGSSEDNIEGFEF